MNPALLRMREIIREIAKPLPNENMKGALARAVDRTGLSPRTVKALLYAEDGKRIAADQDRLDLLEVAYRRHLEAEVARYAGELEALRVRLDTLAQNDNQAAAAATQRRQGRR